MDRWGESPNPSHVRDISTVASYEILVSDSGQLLKRNHIAHLRRPISIEVCFLFVATSIYK